MKNSGPLVALALSLAAAGPVHAQQPPAQDRQAYFEADHVQAIPGAPDEPEQRWFLQGIKVTGLRIEDKELGLRADRAIVWTDPGKGVPKTGALLSSAERVYAEGNVIFFRRDVRTHKIEVFRAERFFLDFKTRTGYFLDLRLDQRPGDDARLAVTLRATEARLAAGGTDPDLERARGAIMGLPGFAHSSPGRLVAFNVVLSTCTYGDPHYEVGLSEAQVDWKWAPGVGGPFGFFMGKLEDPAVGGSWVTVTVWGIPVFAWPSFYLRLAALSALPLERVQGGRTSRFGNSVETTWGFKITKGLLDGLNPFDDDDVKDDKEIWGRLRVELDWRQTRGWAGGIDPSWKWGNYWGYIDSYYLRDDGPDPGNDFDARFLPLERTDRGRIRGFHRQEIDDHFRFELEASWFSDRNVLEEFFEKEFKEGKEQETAAYLRYLDGHRGGYLLGRTRINDFQNQLEYLPKAKAILADEPVLPGAPLGWTFSQEVELANLRQRFDDALGLPDLETWRFDSLSSWSFTLPLAVATLSPFVEARVTAWERGIDGDPADRFLAAAGARLATDFHGVHDVTSDFLGIHRLRHIIHLEARAVAAFENSLDPSLLMPLDATDGLDDFQEISVEMRHRFQTKVIDGQEFRTRDFLEVGAEIEYYPRHERDTVGFNASNFTSPFNWITLGPHDRTKVLDDRDKSNVHWDILFRPSNSLEARAGGEYNPVHEQEEVREYVVTARPREGLYLSVGQVFVFDVTNAFTFGARWDLTEKWRVTADAQFDFKTDDFISRKATIGRDFHDFRLEVVFEEDAGRDERRFYVTFAPTFLRLPR